MNESWKKRLEKDYCNLAEDAKSALLMRQIMRRLLSLIRGKLYDHLLGLMTELATRRKAPQKQVTTSQQLYSTAIKQQERSRLKVTFFRET